MVDKFDWIEEKSWPIDGVGHIFLGRVIAELGDRLYRDEWSIEQAKYTSKRSYLSDQTTASIQARSEAAKLMGKNSNYSIVRGRELEPESLCESEWGEAQQKQKAIANNHNLGRERWLEIKASIHKAFQFGELICFLRGTDRTSSQDFWGPQEAITWNIDDPKKRFETCQVYQKRYSEHQSFWIFVERKSAEAFLSSVSNTKLTAPGTSMEKNAGGRTPKTIKFETECAQWIDTMFISRSKRKKTHTKQEVYDLVVDKFPDIQNSSEGRRHSRTFERIWKEATKNASKWREGDESR